MEVEAKKLSPLILNTLRSFNWGFLHVDRQVTSNYKSFSTERVISVRTLYSWTHATSIKDFCLMTGPPPILPLYRSTNGMFVTLLSLTGEPYRGLPALLPAAGRVLCFSDQKSRKLSSALPFCKAIRDPPLLGEPEQEKAQAFIPGHSREHHSQVSKPASLVRRKSASNNWG